MWCKCNSFFVSSAVNPVSTSTCQVRPLADGQFGLRSFQKVCGRVRYHDDVIKWKHFLRYWPFVRGIHRSPVNSPQNVQWRRTLMFSLIWAWINRWVNNCTAGDLRRSLSIHDVIVMEALQSCVKGWMKSMHDIPLQYLTLILSMDVLTFPRVLDLLLSNRKLIWLKS